MILLNLESAGHLQPGICSSDLLQFKGSDAPPLSLTTPTLILDPPLLVSGHTHIISCYTLTLWPRPHCSMTNPLAYSLATPTVCPTPPFLFGPTHLSPCPALDEMLLYVS